MFSELIYTRCRQGIDILRGGRTIASDGFKVYSCSDNIINDNTVDLPLLLNVAQGKQTFAEPSFMDDAYLFISPDKGKNMMVNFHPIPFDKTASGDYSHRPGNFINQVYIGDFHEFYPYELFGNTCIWDAKERGEAFYYNTLPTPLPVRSNIDDAVGDILQDDVAAFVCDGRKSAVAAAVAFLFAQYSLPVENRKYLVIQDENATKIELWIAAIQSAVSPRMASGLPFATRMDKFTSTNTYAVNLNGQFQGQVNYQDKNQGIRLKAMIIGVDERDRVNTAAVRKLENLPYAVLDGKGKSFVGEVNIAHPYYKLITSYSEQHIRFCRDFLQMIDLSNPCEDVVELYGSYVILGDITEDTPANKIASGLSILGKYNLKKSAYLKSLYETIKRALQRYLQEDLASSFTIMNWLQRTASVVGDEEATQSFKRIVNGAFAECVFANPQSRETSEFWNSIRMSVFYDTVATTLTNAKVLSYYADKMSRFTCDSWIFFLSIYLECARKVQRYTVNELENVISRGLYSCYKNKNFNSALQICDLIEKNGQGTVNSILLEEAKSNDNLYTNFCMNLYLQLTPQIVSSDTNTMRCCNGLYKQGYSVACEFVLQNRAKKLENPVEQERYISALLNDKTLSTLDLSGIFKILDSNLSLSDKKNDKIAAILQNYKPKEVVCINSAHICAATVFEEKSAK